MSLCSACSGTEHSLVLFFYEPLENSFLVFLDAGEGVIQLEHFSSSVVISDCEETSDDGVERDRIGGF